LFFRKAAKATLILFPLLGVPHLLLLHDLAEGGAAQWIYQIFNAVMQAMQVLQFLYINIQKCCLWFATSTLLVFTCFAIHFGLPCLFPKYYVQLDIHCNHVI